MVACRASESLLLKTVTAVGMVCLRRPLANAQLPRGERAVDDLAHPVAHRVVVEVGYLRPRYQNAGKRSWSGHVVTWPKASHMAASSDLTRLYQGFDQEFMRTTQDKPLAARTTNPVFPGKAPLCHQLLWPPPRSRTSHPRPYQ